MRKAMCSFYGRHNRSFLSREWFMESSYVNALRERIDQLVVENHRLRRACAAGVVSRASAAAPPSACTPPVEEAAVDWESMSNAIVFSWCYWLQRKRSSFVDSYRRYERSCVVSTRLFSADDEARLRFEFLAYVASQRLTMPSPVPTSTLDMLSMRVWQRKFQKSSFANHTRIPLCAAPPRRRRDAFPFFSETMESVDHWCAIVDQTVRESLPTLFPLDVVATFRDVYQTESESACCVETKGEALPFSTRAILSLCDMSVRVPTKCTFNANGSMFRKQYCAADGRCALVRTTAVLFKPLSLFLEEDAEGGDGGPLLSPPPSFSPHEESQAPCVVHERARREWIHGSHVCAFCAVGSASAEPMRMLGKEMTNRWLRFCIRTLDSDESHVLSFVDEMGTQMNTEVFIDIRSPTTPPTDKEVACMRSADAMCVAPHTSFVISSVDDTFIFVHVSLPSVRSDSPAPVLPEKLALLALLCVEKAFIDLFDHGENLPPAVLLASHHPSAEAFRACASSFPVCAMAIRRAILRARRNPAGGTVFEFSQRYVRTEEQTRTVSSS